MKLTLPTFLTLLRVLLIPVFIVAFYLPLASSHLISAIIFALAGLTDWFDGYLARKLNQESAFGAFLDPVADKLMVVAAIVLLVHVHPSVWMAIPAVIIISREITVSALREWMAELGSRAVVKVNMIGKSKTFAQFVSILLMLYEEPLLGISMFDVGLVLFGVAALLTIYSMFIYLKAAWPVLSSED